MDDDPINPNIHCHVCGLNEFEEREGFYYCLECGIKQDQVRLVEVENADAFNETTGMKRQTKTIKRTIAKAEKPQLTSWECYNYILRGFVDELLAMGAKEELKLMALQVWAAYLRRMEVAFFNKKHAELPKLGIRYLKNDAETIYNHCQKARKMRRQSRASEAASGTSGGEDVSGRDWRKSKRKLDESMYSSVTSAPTSASPFSTSSASAHTNKAIKLNFNMKARKFLKKRMSVKHLARHEMDAEGILQCHNQPKATEIGRNSNQLMVMSIKQIYAVLGIALNLIGDDIQLVDLVRFIYEGHIGWKKILLYFPENIASHGKELLKRIDFYKYPEKYSEKFMRDHISLLCNNLSIRSFKMPSMPALVQRYVTELCLPQDIATYAERLINFLPPRCNARTKHFLPSYEARAMAYIIFILKLLFGLDGHKEQRMSRAATKLNRKIKNLNRKNAENRPLLFVWNEWVQYIEMRKIIVSHFNPTFCRQFKECVSATQIMEEMSKGIRKRDEQEQSLSEKIENRNYKQQFETFRSLLDALLEQQTPAASELSTATIEFKPTFTPGLSYFKTILLHCDNDANTSTSSIANSGSFFKIPEFMRVDHSVRDMHSYVEVKPLMDFFKNQQNELKVFSLDTTENRHFAGIFRLPRANAIMYPLMRANFDVSEEEWSANIKNITSVGTDDLEWKTSFDPYDEKYFKNRINKLQRLDGNKRPSVDEAEGCVTTSNGGNKINTLSSEVFNESNMDPLRYENCTTEPRRNLDKVNLFEDIINEASFINPYETAASELNNTIPSRDGTPAFANMNTSFDEGIHIKSEFIDETETTEEHSHKFYISNMDCWMLIGCIPLLSKGQRTQLQDKFPPIFKWLVETCAQTLGVKWSIVYEQLLAIEIMFGMGVENLDSVENCVYLSYLNPIKDFQTLINTYREIW